MRRRFLIFALLSVLGSVRPLYSQRVSAPVTLKYSFKTYFPICFRVTDEGEIVAGDGHYIYRFKADGHFIGKVPAPGTDYKGLVFPDLLLENGKLSACFIPLDHHIVGFDIRDGKKNISISGCGDNIKMDDVGNFYSLVQIANPKTNQVENKLKVFKRDGPGFYYKTEEELRADNMEIVSGKIILCNWDSQKCYLLPILGKDYGKIVQHKLSIPDGRPTNFIGTYKDFFVFQYFDHKSRFDVLSFYDHNFKLAYEKPIRLLSKDISDGFKNQPTCDCPTEFRAGNVYSFSRNEIFIMRSTKSGVVIYPLEKLLG